MNHLRDGEFVDLLDGTLPPDRQAHAATCDACRSQVDALRTTLAATAHDTSPEPSPLFWDHFATRVNAAIDAPAPAPVGSWWSRPRLALAGFAAVVVAILALTLVVPSERLALERDTPLVANDAPLPMLTLDDLDDDEAWAVVRAAAEDLDGDTAAAAGLAPPAGSAERLAAQLTEEEQAELIRLVETELKRSGA